MESKLAFPTQSSALPEGVADVREKLASPTRESTNPIEVEPVASGLPDLGTILQHALGNIIELLRLPAGQVWIVERDQLSVKARIGTALGKCAEKDPQVDQCICTECAESGEMIALQDLLARPSTKEMPCARAGFRSIITVPLKTKSQTLGVVVLASPNPNEFATEQRRILSASCYCMAMAVENYELFRETWKRCQAMAALHETSLGIIAQLDTTELLEEMLRRATLLLGAKSCSLFLFDRQTHLIHNVANYNNWRDWTGVTLQPGEGVIGQVVLTGKPVIVDDYAKWVHKHGMKPRIPSTRKMGAPLRWQNQVIGGVVVANELKSAPFDDDDLWLFTQFADLASIAVKNAVLYSQVKQFSQELENQVTARTLELSRAKEVIAARSEQLRLLLAKTIRVQEDERARIARDMHDGALQLINAARYQIQAAEIVAGQELAAPAQDKLLATRELLDEMEQEIRNAISNLRPLILDAVGLNPALEDYTRGLQRVSGIVCHFKVVGIPVKLPTETENSVYHLVQQALSNVTAHSRATETWISLDYQTSILCITVDDNGCGFDEQRWLQEAGRNGKHLGLLGMQERIKSLGGGMHIEPVPGGGTHLSFWLPIQREQHEQADSSIDR